ncbi:alkanesulfonate monooxygenase [Streptomyces sp. Ru62]|uniref:LLM class flavin-dependent oxidoreductase n=1 Tax=Streptomyces sp. Ru62 TaxID=2080745 RepID=UPI000CDDD7B8|nr:LLM class flavin-dependent oxidoreductase [Streptomyces sp. Ru62]POX64502.1 alkanesulfonate monooxygenase [Streptomyces sp. Ru62]
MPVEFVGALFTGDGSEVRPRTTAVLDRDYALRLARAHEDHGWDRVLVAYSAGTPDPVTVSTYIAARLDRLRILLAHRPNACHPTVAARTFATLDQLSGGRLAVHFISGGSQADQEREGDFLTKDERYARTGEYMRIVKKAWTAREPFSHEGTHYRFKDFHPLFPPAQPAGPRISFGGSSPAAFAVGGAEADVYAFWGEPLAHTAAEIEKVRAAARAAGRTDMPRIQVGFRPIIAPTEELAWEKARRLGAAVAARRFSLGEAENTASRRLAAIAREGERYDRALWTGIASLVGGINDCNALVGTPETVAQALLDYYDLGVDVFTLRGYDYIDDTIDIGRYVIPIVREEVAKRESEAGGRRGDG